MVWQDIVASIVMIFLAYALVPQIIKGFKTKKKLVSTQTAIITFLGMCTLAIVYFTLNLFFSTIMSIITGTFWLILFIQGLIYKKIKFSKDF